MGRWSLRRCAAYTTLDALAITDSIYKLSETLLRFYDTRQWQTSISHLNQNTRASSG